MEICWPPGASEVNPLWLLVTEEVWWEIKQLTRKSQINHFPSISYHFLGCSFDLLLICRDTMAAERNPSLFSPSLCLYWEHLAHIAVHMAFVTSVCSVSLGPAVAAKCSSVQEIWPQPPHPTAQHLAHHLPVPWAGTKNVSMLASQASAPQHHCLAWLQPWLFQAWRSYPPHKPYK